MNSGSKAETVKRLRDATGLGWMEATLFLEEHSAELCERFSELITNNAVESFASFTTQSKTIPNLRTRLPLQGQQRRRNHRELTAEENAKIANASLKRLLTLGSCHQIWKLMKEELEKRDITCYRRRS